MNLLRISFLYFLEGIGIYDIEKEKNRMKELSNCWNSLLGGSQAEVYFPEI